MIFLRRLASDDDLSHAENALRSRPDQAQRYLREASTLRHARLQPHQHLYEMEEAEERRKLYEILVGERRLEYDRHFYNAGMRIV